MEKSFTPEKVLERMASCWERVVCPGKEVNLNEREGLGELARRIQAVAVPDLIQSHPLAPIVTAALQVLVEHGEAADSLAGKRVAATHTRQIEEGTATLQYLVSDPSKYDLLAWRWSNFKTIHAIRNRLFNLKKPLDPLMEKWIKGNHTRLREVSSKFKGDVEKDRDFWMKFGAWMAPVTIKEIFEKTGRLAAYQSQEYEWGSHLVHFSPLHSPTESVDAEEVPISAQLAEFSTIRLVGVLRTVHPLLVKQAPARALHLRLGYRELYLMLRDEPDRFLRLNQQHERFQQIVGEVVRDAPDSRRLEVLVLGSPPTDPLVVKVQASPS